MCEFCLKSWLLASTMNYGNDKVCLLMFAEADEWWISLEKAIETVACNRYMCKQFVNC